jgi:hypothetical protein
MLFSQPISQSALQLVKQSVNPPFIMLAGEQAGLSVIQSVYYWGSELITLPARQQIAQSVSKWVCMWLGIQAVDNLW